MKIGMILDAPFPPDLRVEKEALTLVENGHEVVLFCLDYESAFFEDKYKGITLAHYPASIVEYKLSALAYTVPLYHWMMAAKLDKFVKRYKPDVLHVHDMVIAAAAKKVAMRYDLRVVLDLHENRPEIMKEYLHLQKFPGKFLIDLSVWKRRQIELVRFANDVIVVTEEAKTVVADESSKPIENIFVIPNTPSAVFLDYPVDKAILLKMEGRYNLLYVGDTSERRGTADMLLLTRALVKSIPQLCLWVVGKSSFDSRLHALAAELGVSSHVQFEGWQPEKTFPSYITGAHVCLSPLKRNLHHDTTFANKVFQYMSFAKPVVVSDCPAQANLIRGEKAGLVYRAGDIADFCKKILMLYQDPAMSSMMGTSGAHAVRSRWNWENTSRPLIALYKSME